MYIYIYTSEKCSKKTIEQMFFVIKKKNVDCNPSYNNIYLHKHTLHIVLDLTFKYNTFRYFQ